MLGAMGQEQGHRPRLIEAREIPEITVLAEGMLHVGVVRRQGGGRDHRRHATEAVQEASAPLRIGRGVNRRRAGVGWPWAAERLDSQKLEQPV